MINIRRVSTLCLLALVASACLKLRQPPQPPPPEYMDTTDRFELLDVEETTEPTGIFVLDGKPLCFAGTNNYYLTFKSRRMADDVLDNAVAMNLKVLRVWANLDRGSLDGTVKAVDPQWPGDGTKEGVWFQHFNPQTGLPEYNEGENGLSRLDYVVHAARQRGLKLILVLTNSWRDFGGMEQYLTWFGLTRHHEFYTDERVRDAYRRWAAYLIDRVNTIDGVVYRDDPAIFAWELANEPRCVIGSEFDSRDGWTTDTIVDWAEEMSAFIKERDPNHMVAVGDEGFLNDRGTTWLYQAEAGVDHEALCAIDTIDFCTFHLYPDDWGTGYKFGYQWIERHLEVARKLGKPTVLEEYGTHVKRSETDLSKFEWGWERRATAYNNWLSILRSRGGNGAMFWILVGVDDQLGMYPDYDHYSVYRDLPTATLLQPHTDGFDTAPACRLGASLIDGTEPSPFVRAIHLHEHPQAGVPTTEMP